MKKEHDRSLPHYEEALTIKNALAGFSDSGGSDFSLTDEKDNFILRCLDDNTELPVVSKATLSTSMTHIRMASVYAKVCSQIVVTTCSPTRLTILSSDLSFAEKALQLLFETLLPCIENPEKSPRPGSLYDVCPPEQHGEYSKSYKSPRSALRYS
jgi:hypothetical protein